MLRELIWERMKRFKNQTMSDEKTTLTYAEALAFAEGFTSELTAPKIGVPIVGILCHSELHTGLAILSCIAAGMTAVPLSVRYGEAHVARIVRHIGLSHIITDEDGVLAVKQIAPAPPEPEDLPSDSSDSIAFIMCTSGTTGNPKGAMITRGNLKNNLLDIERYFAIDQPDTILIARPLYHCAVLTGEFLISLCRGLNIRFYNGEFNPVRLMRAMSAQQVTVLGGTPTLFYHLCQMAGRSKQPLSLRVAVVSGECMTETAAKVMRSAMPDANIYNVYGLTEASPRVAALPPEMFDEHPLSVGFPLQTVQAKIEGGELLIRGKTVMRGYYNDPEQTARAFSDGWLHTGDGASIDGAGRITIKGRLDNMIIRAGMNIFPQEIESALKADPRITETLVYGEHSGVTQRLCVKIAAKGLTKADIMAICRERLPAYEIPDAVEMVEALPRNASGKLLRPKAVTPA